MKCSVLVLSFYSNFTLAYKICVALHRTMVNSYCRTMPPKCKSEEDPKASKISKLSKQDTLQLEEEGEEEIDLQQQEEESFP